MKKEEVILTWQASNRKRMVPRDPSFWSLCVYLQCRPLQKDWLQCAIFAKFSPGHVSVHKDFTLVCLCHQWHRHMLWIVMNYLRSYRRLAHQGCWKSRHSVPGYFGLRYSLLWILSWCSVDSSTPHHRCRVRYFPPSLDFILPFYCLLINNDLNYKNTVKKTDISTRG